MDTIVSELTPSLNVTEFRINVVDLDYIQLGEKLQPTKVIVAINSNFIHKAFEGYDQFISKPKVKRTRKIDSPVKASSGSGKTRPGDHTTFNACIEFTVIVDDEGNSKVARYFPRSGTIQLFGDISPISIIINYLTECDLPEFESVSLVGECKTLLQNYRFSINIDTHHYIDLFKLACDLESNDEIKSMLPFSTHYIKFDANDIHSKIAIVFTTKIRVHIWPKSGKVNIFGTKTALSASLIYEFIRDAFTAKWDSYVRNSPQKNI
jgi:hypothetical protein